MGVFRLTLKPVGKSLATGLCLSLAACSTMVAPTAVEFSLRKPLAEGNYSQAESVINEQYGNSDQHQSLYHFEMASLKQLAGEYRASSDEFNRLAPMDLESTGRKYRPTNYERAHFPYLNAMNYVMLHQQDHEQSEQWLENARVFARQSTNTLNKIVTDEGDYLEQNEADKSLLNKIGRGFEILLGQYQDRDKLIYRDDAWLRYINGLVFEISGQYDNARVNYEQAATLFETGYGEQFGVEEATNPVWFDTIRMMKKTGRSENRWSQLAKEKLSESQQAEIDDVTQNEAELVIVEHLDFLPAKQQMKLEVMMDTRSQSLRIAPILYGSARDQADQLAWFTMMYADNGLFNIMLNYNKAGGIYAAYQSIFVKEIYFPGDSWELLEELGVVGALSSVCPMIISIPYLPSERQAPKDTILTINGEDFGELIEVSSPSKLALQQQLLNAGADLRKALASQLLVAGLSQHLTEDLGTFGALLKCANNLKGAVLAFDTRSWSTLPYSIRYRRISLPAGTHQVLVQPGVNAKVHQQKITLKPGEVQLLPVHSINPNKPNFFSLSSH